MDLPSINNGTQTDAAARKETKKKRASFKCPGALQIVTVDLPNEITKPFWGKDDVSFTDCAENCVLRFVQLALLNDPNEDVGVSGGPSEDSDKDFSRRINVARAAELGAIPEVVQYFERFPLALEQFEYTSSMAGLSARAAWATLVSQRDGCAYVRTGGFEMNAGVGNFLAVIQALFPYLGLPAGSMTRSDDGSVYKKGLQLTCDFFSTPSKRLGFEKFAFDGPTRCERTIPPSWDWVHPIYGGDTENSVAIDRKASAQLAINGTSHLTFSWWDRDFPAERDLVAVTSGHAQLYDCA